MRPPTHLCINPRHHFFSDWNWGLTGHCFGPCRVHVSTSLTEEKSFDSIFPLKNLSLSAEPPHRSPSCLSDAFHRMYLGGSWSNMFLFMPVPVLSLHFLCFVPFWPLKGSDVASGNCWNNCLLWPRFPRHPLLDPPTSLPFISSSLTRLSFLEGNWAPLPLPYRMHSRLTLVLCDALCSLFTLISPLSVPKESVERSPDFSLGFLPLFLALTLFLIVSTGEGFPPSFFVLFFSESLIAIFASKASLVNPSCLCLPFRLGLSAQ